jgi:hypothetical protein
MYEKVQNKLYKTDKKIEKFEEDMFNEWKNIESLNLFKSQRDYFEYMISLPRFKKLMDKKNKLNLKIEEIDFLIKKECEHYKKYTKFMKYIDIPDLTEEEINNISLKLDGIILPFVLFKDIERKNFLSLPFLINKILINKKTFKCVSNIQEFEKIWKKICIYNEWELY